MNKRFAVIGFGEMGKRHGLEFREATGGLLTLCGVVEKNPANYRNGCNWNQCDVPNYDTVEELLREARPDGILISTPNFTHLEILEQLKNYRGVILLEKPLDANLDNIAEIVRFARNYPGIILVDHVMRYAPIIREAKAMIEAGKIGKVASFNFSQRAEAGALYHTFRRTIAEGGGQMLEKATHDIDVALFLTGSLPEKVMMVSRQQLYGGDKPNDLTCSKCPENLTCLNSTFNYNRKLKDGLRDVEVADDLCVFAQCVNVPDNESCTIECTNGIFGNYSHNYFSLQFDRSRNYEIIGVLGAIYIELYVDGRGILHYYPRTWDGKKEVRTFDYGNKIHYNGGAYLGRHFYNLMTGKEQQPFTTVEAAFIAEAVGLAAMKSAELKRYVDVSEIIPDDLKSILQKEE